MTREKLMDHQSQTHGVSAAVGINALNLTADLADEDACVPGVYLVHVNMGLSPSERASAALDYFHAHVAVDTLDDFSFAAFDMSDHRVLAEDEDANPEAWQGEATSIEKISAWPFSEFDVLMRCAADAYATRALKVMATDLEQARARALALASPALPPTALVRFEINKLAAAHPAEVEVIITFKARVALNGADPHALRAAIERNLSGSVARGLLDGNDRATVEEHGYEVMLTPVQADQARATPSRPREN